jgi:hypothetical protein
MIRSPFQSAAFALKRSAPRRKGMQSKPALALRLWSSGPRKQLACHVTTALQDTDSQREFFSAARIGMNAAKRNSVTSRDTTRAFRIVSLPSVQLNSAPE